MGDDHDYIVGVGNDGGDGDGDVGVDVADDILYLFEIYRKLYIRGIHFILSLRAIFSHSMAAKQQDKAMNKSNGNISS